MNRQALSTEPFLEISLRIFGVVRPRHLQETLVRGGDFFHLLKIIEVVRCQAQLAVRKQCDAHGIQKFTIHQASVAMLPLGPRIGKHHVKNRHRLRRQQMADGIKALHAYDTDVAQSGPRCAAADFADAPHQAFDPQKIVLRMLFRHSDEESPLAAADIDFQRGGTREQIIDANRRKIIFGNVLDRLRIGRVVPAGVAHFATNAATAPTIATAPEAKRYIAGTFNSGSFFTRMIRPTPRPSKAIETTNGMR